MWRRGRNRANPRIIPAWGKSKGSRDCSSNNNYSNSHGRSTLAKGGAAVVGGGAATTAGSGPRLEPPVGGGEEGLTLDLWLCPPCDLAMLRLEKERRWRKREEEDFCFEGKEMM